MKRFVTLFCAMMLSAPVMAADVPVFHLTIKDHKFEPASLDVPADTKVKLLVKNEDPTAEEFESHDLNREKVIPGGKEATIFVGPLKAGEYKFFGEFHEKTAQGILKVK